MGRMRKMEAKLVLDGEVAALGLSFASFEVRDGVRPGANDLAWWHEHTPPAERSETKYNLAHLRAYVRIAGVTCYQPEVSLWKGSAYGWIGLLSAAWKGISISSSSPRSFQHLR